MATVGAVLRGVLRPAVVAYVFAFGAADRDLMCFVRARWLLRKLPHILLQLVQSCYPSWWSDSVLDVPPWVSRPVAKLLRLRERELGLSGFVIKGGPRALL